MRGFAKSDRSRSICRQERLAPMKWTQMLLSMTLAVHVAGSGARGQPEITVELPGGSTMEMIWIEPGAFRMGTPESDQYAMRVLDSGGTATNHFPSVPTNFVNLSLAADFDRGASFGSGNIVISRDKDHSQGGEVNFHYNNAIAGDDITSMHGSCFCNRFTNGIEGFRLFTDGVTAEMVGTIRLWGLPNA